MWWMWWINPEVFEEPAKKWRSFHPPPNSKSANGFKTPKNPPHPPHPPQAGFFAAHWLS
jgi:hypothetical protein